jgi:hypothetical protein
VRTIKLTLKPESRDGMAIELEVEAIIADEYAAYDEGREVATYITQFLGGFTASSEVDNDADFE